MMNEKYYEKTDVGHYWDFNGLLRKALDCTM